MKVIKLKYIIYTFCMFIIIGMMCVYLPNPYLWYDEAGQFFISQGLNHYSDPFSPEGGLYDVIVNNRGYNMDPGGFSVILFFWQKISTSYFWLRLLPVLFFFGFDFALYKVSVHETKNKTLSVVIATLPFILPVFTNRITELRAYSMEMMGVLLIVWLIIRYKDNLNIRCLLFLSAVQMLFMTSRYGCLVVVFGASLYVLYLLYQQNKLPVFVPKSIVYGLPLIITVLVVYFGMMFFQNSHACQMGYASYLSSSPQMLLSLMSILYYAVILIAVLKGLKKKRISELHILALIIGTIYFILSALGLYPWEMHRTISAYTLFVFTLIIELAKWLEAKSCINKDVIAFLFLVPSLFLWGGLYKMVHRNITEQQLMEYTAFVEKYQFKKMRVEATLNPILRYQYEYGTLKDVYKKHKYPERFHLVDGGSHSFNAKNKYDILTSETDCDIVWNWDDEKPAYCEPIAGHSHFYKFNLNIK